MASVWEKSGTGRTGLVWFQHLFTKHGSDVISVLTAGWPNNIRAALAAGSRWSPVWTHVVRTWGEGGGVALPPLSKEWFAVLGVRWAGGQLEWRQVHAESV